MCVWRNHVKDMISTCILEAFFITLDLRSLAVLGSFLVLALSFATFCFNNPYHHVQTLKFHFSLSILFGGRTWHRSARHSCLQAWQLDGLCPELNLTSIVYWLQLHHGPCIRWSCSQLQLLHFARPYMSMPFGPMYSGPFWARMLVNASAFPIVSTRPDGDRIPSVSMMWQCCW